MKKWIAWLLMAALTVSCVMGAFAVEVSEDGVVYLGSEGEYADPGYRPVGDGEPVTVKIAHRSDPNLTYFGSDTEEDNWYLRMLEKQLNIDIVYDQMIPTSDYNATLSLVIAGGELPDAMVVDASAMQELMEAGKVKDMTEIYNKYASEYVKEIYGWSDVVFENCTMDGKLYGLPSQDSTDGTCTMLWVRQDWLDKLGLEVPKTLDDLISVARAFMTQDPDGNGEADTWGIGATSAIYRDETGWGAITGSLESFFHTRNSFPSLFYWNEDHTEVLYGGLQPQTKEALAQIRELVQEGVIKKDFATLSWDQVNEAIYNDKCGLVLSPWWQCVANDQYTSGKIWMAYAVPLNDEGRYVSPMSNPTGQYIVVNAEASDEVAEAVMKICNIQAYTGGRMMAEDVFVELRKQEGYEGVWFANTYFPFLCNLDQHDKHSAMAGDAKAYYAGEMAFEDLPGEAQGLVPKWDLVMKEPYNGDLSAFLVSDDFQPWPTQYTAYLNAMMELYLAREAGVNQLAEPVTFKLNASESWVEYGASLVKLQKEYFTKIALGELELDAFDEFVNLWLSVGGQDVINELTDYVNGK